MKDLKEVKVVSVLLIGRAVTVALLVIVTPCERVCPEAVDTVGLNVYSFCILATISYTDKAP